MKALCLFLLLAAPVRGGDLLLQFDDGFENWINIIAPELKKAGGTATGYVNIDSIERGRISQKSLERLKKEYAWEIGTHSYHHLEAPAYVRKHGLDTWLEKEFNASLADLSKRGFEVRSMAFPFNSHTPEIAQAIQPYVKSWRRADPIGILSGQGKDGSFPALSIDIAHHRPVSMILKLIDLAAESGQSFSIYGHRVLPDEAFATVRVKSVKKGSIQLDSVPRLSGDEGLLLVPLSKGQVKAPAPFPVNKVEGDRLTLERPEMTSYLKPGMEVLIGPSYGTPLSDFRAILNHAKGKLTFRTVSESLGH